MDVYEAVTKRRSIRKFKDIPVPYELLERCINGARLAPTARNNQFCSYIAVDDEQLLPSVFNTVGAWAGQVRPENGWPPEHSPKAHIVTLINTCLEAEFVGSKRDTYYDVGLAAENIILVALEQGIGGCLITSFEPSKLRQVLNIQYTRRT